VVEHSPGLTHSLDYSKEGLAVNATRICIVDACDRDYYSRGYCNRHYLKLKRYGDATANPPSRVLETATEANARFDASIQVADSGCWEWIRTRNREGYGHFAYNYQTIRAHRWSYERAYGPVPDGLVVGHKCDNKPCVNPDHLEAITVQQNTQDAHDRGLVVNQESRKTHCVNGHLLPPADENNRRVCMACRVARQKVRRALRRSEVEGDKSNE
jgi:hypothetical protein